MRTRWVTALPSLLLACGVTAGCAPGTRTTTDASAATALNCGAVVDRDASGYFKAPLTAGRAIGLLSQLQRGAGNADIAKGRLSSQDRRTLDTVATELIGYSGSKLSADAAAFSRTELEYSPNGLPLATAYARPLQRAIAALERDCPSADRGSSGVG